MVKRRPHSCKGMKAQLSYDCDRHSDPYDCPDALVVYVPQFDEYGLIVHDGGKSYVVLKHCPWCGNKLPLSKRDKWFDTLTALGYKNPFKEKVPPEFLSDEWYSGIKAKKPTRVGRKKN
jgi:uncharacterized protein DUF6980